MILTAFSMPLLVGAAGLAVDTTQWTLWKRQLQRSADSAAMAGAYARAQSKDVATAARTDLEKSLDTEVSTTLVQNPPPTGTGAGNNRAVRVELSKSATMPFSNMFLGRPVAITVTATAAIVRHASYCVIALDSSQTTTVLFQGNASLSLNCGIMANASGANAISAGGSTTITATPVSSVGGITGASHYSSGTKLEPYSLPEADPFASLPTPTVTCNNGPQVHVSTNSSASIGPGCYKGMDVKGNLTLAAGTYYIDGGAFSIGAQATVSGTGVTIVLTSSTPANANSIANFDIAAGAHVNLTAPSSGPVSGVLIYEDRRAPSTRQTKINGNTGSTLEGAIYFPSSNLLFNGTAGMNTRCVQIVANRVTFTGDSSISNVCPPTGPRAIDGTRVRLIA